MKDDALQFLKERLSGKIIKVINPNDHGIEEIVRSYLLLIIWLARRYVRPTVELEDLVDEGIIGLLDAINRFDPERANSKNAFHNLAIVRIKHFMFSHLLDNSSMYHVPTYMARAMSLVDRARSILSNYSYNGSPESGLLEFEAPYKEDNFPKDAENNLREIKQALKDLANQSRKTYEEFVTNILKIEHNIMAFEGGGTEEQENPSEEGAESREFLNKFLSGLTETAREVMYLRLNGFTLEDTGKTMGFTRERARQIEAETLTFFRKTRMFREASDLDFDSSEE